MNSVWMWILAASAVAFLTKLSGFLLPSRWLSGPRMTQVFSSITIGLLAALVTLNILAQGNALTLDARIGALLAAIVALLCRASFLLVVACGGAVAAALLRLAGFS